MDFAKFRRALKQNKQANKKQNKKCFELKSKTSENNKIKSYMTEKLWKLISIKWRCHVKSLNERSYWGKKSASCFYFFAYRATLTFRMFIKY